MNNSIIKIESVGVYSDPKLEDYIKQSHEKFELEARQWGVTSAILNTIKDQSPLHIILETVYRSYDDLCTETHKRIDGILQIAQGKLEIDKLNSEIIEHRKEEENCEKNHQLEAYRIGYVTIPNFPYKKLLWGFFLCLIVLIFDAIQFASAYQIFGSSYSVSLLVGFVFTFTLAIVTILGTIHIEKYKSKANKIIGYVGLITLVISSIYLLCEIRSKYVELNSGYNVAVWKMVLLTLIGFTGFHLIHRYILDQANKTIKERKDAFLKLQHLKRLKEKLNSLKSTISTKLNAINHIKQSRLSKLSYAKATEIKINRLYKQAVSEFKKAYILKSSGNVPSCFALEAPELTSFYSDYEINPKSHGSHEN